MLVPYWYRLCLRICDDSSCNMTCQQGDRSVRCKPIPCVLRRCPAMDLRRTVIVQLRCKPLHCNSVLGSGRYRTSRRLQLRPDEEPGRPSLAVVGLRRRCLVELDRDSCVGTEVGPRPHLRGLRPCIGSGRGPSSLGHSAQHAPLVVVLYRGLRVPSNYSPSTVMAWRPWPAGYRSLFSANHPFHNRSSNQVRTAITTRMSTSDARNCDDRRVCRSRRRRTVIPPYLLIKDHWQSAPQHTVS